MNKQNFKIIIGLGNPGQEYRRTYHNAGSMFIDYLAEYFSPNEPFKKPRFKNFEFINNDKSIIVKTLAFMNLSGGSVLSALKYFSAGKSAIKPEEILIAHDDVDIGLLQKIVDNLGGIDVDLKSPLTDWASGYTIQAGNQHLDGTQVVWLVRNRYAPNGDFFREKNQHQIIQTIAQKIEGLNALEKTAFLFKLTPDLATSINTNMNPQIFITLMEKFHSVRFNDVVMDFGSGLLESATTTAGSSTEDILLPVKGSDNYDNIRNYIESKLEK